MGEEEQDSEKGGGGEDLISGLPDDILSSSILSLLSMKDEVKTSILSTRWRYLWTSRPNLEFDPHTMMVGKSILLDGWYKYPLKGTSRDEEEGLRVLNSEFASRVVTNLPKDIPHLESLFLPLTTEMTMLPAKIASYVNLKELKLEAFSRASVDFFWIVSTIDALPLLSKLLVMLHPAPHRTQEGVRPMITSGSPHNQLKEVMITGFFPFFYQTELVIYLLKNCVALKRMTIDPKFRIYNMNWELKDLNDCRIWKNENGEFGKFYELIHTEVPGRGGLVTIL